MGLVLILTGSAVIVLKAYNAARSTPLFDTLIPGLRQQAAVVATLAGMVFALLDALEKGKVAASLLTGSGSPPPVNPGPSYGGPVGPRGGLAQIAVSGVVPG